MWLNKPSPRIILKVERIKKWVVVSSVQLDRVRTSWVEYKKSVEKLETDDILKANRLLWGDLYFLYIALNNLFKAFGSKPLPKSIIDAVLYKDLRKDIRLLRDIHEHWEQKEIRSLKIFETRHKNASPYTIRLKPFEKFEASVLDLNEIQSIILKLENALDP